MRIIIAIFSFAASVLTLKLFLILFFLPFFFSVFYTVSCLSIPSPYLASPRFFFSFCTSACLRRVFVSLYLSFFHLVFLY